MSRDMKLLRFSFQGCGACKAMERAKTLDKFLDNHPGLKVRYVDTDTAKGGDLADEMDVKAVPTFIFVDRRGDELRRAEGAMSLTALEKLFKKAKEELAFGDDDDEDDDDAEMDKANPVDDDDDDGTSVDDGEDDEDDDDDEE